MRMSRGWIVVAWPCLVACGAVEASDDDEDSDVEASDDADSAGDADAGPEVDTATDADAGADADLPDEAAAEAGEDTDPDADVAEATTAECGNGRVEAPDEECDDGNAVSGDGCEDDCTFSCHEAADCADDGNQCTTEVCAAVTGGRACGHDFNTLPCDDADPCTTGDRCAAGACAGSLLPSWYPDADGDRYGDPEVSVCAAVAPSGYVGNALDCCDLDNQVRPDQTAWFDAASATCTAATGEAFWDYNCSGLVEPRDTVCGACVSSGTACTTAPSGWAPAADGTCVVECGADASWISSCRRDASSCLPNVMTVRQRCH